MNTPLWSDDQFRSFFATLRSDLCGSDRDDDDRDRFLAQARVRVAPAVQQRLLADIGATTDPGGIARVALDVVEDQAWSRRRSWLLVTTDPWTLVVDLVTREIRSSYRSATRRSGGKRDLDGIARASGRLALPPPDGIGEGPGERTGDDDTAS